jgi:two-component system, cell cycle response regulator DivK
MIMTRNGTTCLTVLVVDDFADARLTLRRMLELRDYRVVEAVNGRAAVEAAKRVCPDLILMDLNMPEMDGLAATEQIRACKDACKGVPIIALTAYDTYGMKEAALAAGCDDYVTRPIDFEQLDKVLQRYLIGW